MTVYGTIFRWASVSLALAWCIASAASARADCDLKIANLKTVYFSGHGGRGYEVFNPDQFAEIVEVTIQRKSGSCPFFVGFSTGGGGGYAQRRLVSGGGTLSYQLFKTIGGNDVLKDFPVASSEEIFSGTLLSGQDSVTFSFVFVIPFQQVVRPGVYADSLTVRVYEGTVQGAQLRDQEQLSLAAAVPTVAQFALGNQVTFDVAQPSACVDFGQLVSGATRDLRLRARSNSGYRIRMESRNGGALRIKDPRDDSQIPYRLEVDCNPFVLGKHPTTVLEQTGLTAPGGQVHTLTFTIGEVAMVSEGSYEDVIVVTMYPNR